MGMFIFLVGFVLFIVSIIMILINVFKKKPKKKLAIAAAVGFVLLIIGPSLSPDSKKETTSKTSETSKVSESNVSSTSKETIDSSSASPEETKQSEKKSDDTEINKMLADDLQKDLGWALGKLDSDGNPTENGTPNKDFSWAIFVEKIEVAEDGTQLNVYVTPEFTSLDKESKSEIIGYAQNASSVYTENAEKLFTVVYQGEKQIGRSTVLDKSEFKFDKE